MPPSDVKAPIVFRKVVSGKAPVRMVTGPPPSPMKGIFPGSHSQVTSNSQGQIQMRKAVGTKKPKDDEQTQTQEQISLVPQPVLETRLPHHPEQVPVVSHVSEFQQAEDSGPAVLAPPPPPTQVDPQPLTQVVIESADPVHDQVLSTPGSDFEPQRGTRRTTRSRKPPQGQGEPFKPAPRSRRKAPASTVDEGFAGLTALALRTLTTSNTTRNQQRQTVELTTEVIRIDGARPDSPTTKVRTILERQKELRIKQRQERAERRRRITEGLAEEDINEVDGVSEVNDVSMMETEQDENGAPLRHRLGPGEDEVYVTPPRPDRPSKRGRFENDQEEVQDEKRVKWERGLSTIVYFDSSSPKPRRSTQEDVIKKGCLTPGAKVRSFICLVHLMFGR